MYVQFNLTTSAADRQDNDNAKTRKLRYSKDNRAMRAIYGCRETFSGAPDYTHG